MVVKTITIKVKVLELNEKAKSRAQQRFFGMVRAAQKGEGAASPEVAKVADEISDKDAKKFAKTKHKGLPGDKTKKEKTASMFKLMWSMKKKGAKPHYKPGTDKKYEKYQEDWKPEIEHSKLGDAVKKKREKKRKEAEASLPPHLRLDVMKKAFASTNEETSMPNVEKKDRGAIKKRFKGLFKKDIKGTVAGVNEGKLHDKMDTFKSKAVKRRDDNALGTISSATKRYELLKKLIGSKKKHDKPAIKK